MDSFILAAVFLANMYAFVACHTDAFIACTILGPEKDEQGRPGI